MIALADVNVLIALAWPNHIHHASAARWFLTSEASGWATAPVTESGFVRVSSNRSALPTATTVEAAVALLRELRQRPGHTFWFDDVSVAAAPELDFTTLAGHRQVTDAHLLALAIRRGGRLVTFDRGVVKLGADHVELLRA